MQNPRRVLLWLLTAGCFIAFFVFGFTDNLKGATLPALIRDLGLSYTVGGSILLGAYVGFLVATLFTGMLADLAGKKMVLLVAAVLLFLGTAGYSIFRTPLMLASAMFCLGLGMGATEVGANALIVDLHPARKGFFLNLMSVFHGLGSTLAPLLAGFLIAASISWQVVYRIASVLAIALFAYFLLVRYQRTRQPVSEGLKFSSLRKNAFAGRMSWYYFLIAVYVAAEIGIASWIVEFLQTHKNLPVQTSTQALSLYFGLMMVGRFLGSFAVDRIGYLRIMLLASASALVSASLGIFGPAQLAFFLPLTGFFYSIIFPTITATVSDLHKDNMGAILGLLFTFAGVGGMVGPWLVGAVADWLGLVAGFCVVLFFTGLMAASFAFLLLSSEKIPSIAVQHE